MGGNVDTRHSSSRPAASALSRRKVLKAGLTAAAAGAATGWLGGKAPVFAQQRRIHFLLNSNFRPPFDVEVRALAKDFQKLSGIEVNPEFILNNDIPARITAAVESKQGPDIFIVQWNQTHIFAPALTDVSDIVAGAGGDAIYPSCRAAVQVDGVYRAYPWYVIGCAMTYNKPLCDKLGITKYAETHEDLLVIGKKMKQAGTPVGWCLGHTNGDGAFGNYPIFWSFGAAEVDEQGRVIINSKEARLAIEWMRQFWADCCDEGGMGWNDASNNQAFLAQQVACVYNPPSIILLARQNKMPIADQIVHTINVTGPAGRFHLNQSLSIAIPKYTPHMAEAREWLRYLVARPQYERSLNAGGSFALGNSPQWEKTPLWVSDPVLAPFGQVTKYGRNMGYKGPFSRASAEVQNKYIIADTLARGIRDGADSALAWAEHELKQIYDRRA